MISYKPFYQTLFRKNITEYQLIYNYGFSANTLHRMKHGRNITLKTLDTLCSILECDIADIISYHPDEALVQADRTFEVWFATTNPFS